MRPEPVPCKNATQYEIDQDKHLTWEDDGHCTVCKRILDRFAARREEAEELENDEPEYAEWNTGICMKCGGAGILGVKNDAHPSVYGMTCPDCEGETP